METKTYNICMIGAGNISRMHLEGIKRHPERVKPVAICDPDTEAACSVASDYGIKNTYRDMEEAIGVSEIDVAVVCTPTHVRNEVILPLLETGIPVFCEKPFAETYSEAKELAETARQKNVPVAINQNFRRFFSFALARDIIRQKNLGQPLHLIQSSAVLRRDIGWRLTRKRYVMAVMSIHWFDGYRFMLDDEPEEVYCRSIDSPATDGGKDTAMSVILRFSKGTVAALSESFSSYTGLHCCSLDFESGGLEIGYDALTEIHADGTRKAHSNKLDKPEASYRLLDNLINSAEKGIEPETSAFDNLKSMRIMEAAYRSAECKSPVKVEDIT